MRLRSLTFWLLLLLALGIAATLTTLRVLQADAAWAATAVAFTPLAVPAYALALLLVLWRVVRGRRRWLVGLVVPLAGLCVHGWWLAPLWTGANPPAPPQAQRLTVMTAGLDEGSADGLAVVRLASEYQVDLLALQDATPQLLEQMDSAGLGELFPHRAGTPAAGADGTLLLSRTPVTADAPLETGHGSVDAEVEQAGGSLRVVVVRVRPLDDADGWRADHEEVLSAARDGVDLVVGDLNATADHEQLEALADAGLRDAAELANAGWQPTWPAEPVPLAALDHVLVGPRLAALSSRTAPVADSDHEAVIARLALK